MQNKPKNKRFYDASYKKGGQAVMVVVVVFLFIALTIILGIVAPTADYQKSAFGSLKSKQSLTLAESGQEDIQYRIMRGLVYDSEEVINLGGYFATTTIDSNLGGFTETTSTGDVVNYIRKTGQTIFQGNIVSFEHGILAGDDGVRLSGSAQVFGTIFSNGGVVALSSNFINGNVTSAGANGLIDGAHINLSAQARMISNSSILGDAHYQEINDSSVGGQLFPESPDAEKKDFPISDEILDDWQEVAESGGTMNCPLAEVPPGSGNYDRTFNINRDIVIGPIKVNCDVVISQPVTLTLAGPVWIVGDLMIQNGATIRLSEELGVKSVAVITDGPDRNNSSKITINGITNFTGLSEKAFAVLVSRNENSTGGSAITTDGATMGDLVLYSNHGRLTFSGNNVVKAVAGHKIELIKSAGLVAENDVGELYFDSIPDNAWKLFYWREE